MDRSKILAIFILFQLFDVDYVLSLPTFGSEHVHIKVHIPAEHSKTDNILKSKYKVKQYIPKPHANHYKIIHHYHHHAGGIKGLHIRETEPAQENFYLSELDKDNLHQHKQNEEAFLIKSQSNNPITKDDLKTVEIIEEIGHQPKKGEFVKSQEDTLSHHHAHNIGPHIETVHIINDKPLHQYQQEHHSDYNLSDSKEEVIKIIDAPKYIAPITDYSHVPQVKEVIEDVFNVEDYFKRRAKNHNYGMQYGYVLPQKQIFSDYSPQGAETIKQTSFALHSSVDLKESSLKYLTDYQKYLPSSENPKNFNESHPDFTKYYSANMDSDQNNEDSHTEESPSETYTGHDSYRAAHVQGLGSGRYSNHKLI